jgi:RNA polymerase sigma-70 factor, ECF subfamily
MEAPMSEIARRARAAAVTHCGPGDHDDEGGTRPSSSAATRDHDRSARSEPSQPANAPAAGCSDPAQTLTALFRAHGDLVDRCLARAGVDPADRDDALQDVFLLAMRKLAVYDERGAARAWLVAIARRVASDRRRRNRRRVAREQAGYDVSSAPPAPDIAASRREDAGFVQRFLRSLSPEMAECFVLCDIESMTAPEVAGALGVSVNTVYSRLRLARGKFRRALAERERGGGNG